MLSFSIDTTSLSDFYCFLLISTFNFEFFKLWCKTYMSHHWNSYFFCFFYHFKIFYYFQFSQHHPVFFLIKIAFFAEGVVYEPLGISTTNKECLIPLFTLTLCCIIKSKLTLWYFPFRIKHLLMNHLLM